MKTDHLCDLMKLFGLTIQWIKNEVPVSLSKKTADGMGQTLFWGVDYFFFSVVVRSHLFDIRVMRACLIAREKSVTCLIKIETACVVKRKTKIYFRSESFFILFVYFNVFAIRFATRYCTEVCYKLQGVFLRHGFWVTQPEWYGFGTWSYGSQVNYIG